MQEKVTPFEYCFVKNIANPPSTNLTVSAYPNQHVIVSMYIMQIEDRLLADYQVLNELNVPLGDVENYEAHLNNDSDTYRKLAWTKGQLSTSLEDMQNIVNTNFLNYIPLHLFVF